MEIKGVKIGDKFKHGKTLKAKVIDIHVITSMKTGKLVGYRCMASGEGTLATNEFEVPFATVVRGRI